MSVPQLLEAIRPAMAQFIQSGSDVSETRNLDQSLDARSPNKFAKAFSLNLPDEPSGIEGMMNLVNKLFDGSINTWDQKFMHKLTSSSNPIGIVSEMVLAVLNAQVVVFETSPALSALEKQTARQLANVFGFSGPRTGGVCLPGGSMSNMTAMTVARNIMFPEVKKDGAYSQKLAVFTSEAAHFSIQRAAIVMGIGKSQVITVPTNDQGQMVPSHLQERIEDAIKGGLTPFFVNATAGTTVYGAFDPLPEIGAICKAKKLGFHIDASWGGAVAFSSKEKARMAGCEKADSLAFNPHKMLGVPLPCSFLLTNDIRILHEANSVEASYLFHLADKHENRSLQGVEQDDTDDGIWDLGSLTLWCGRRGDALKFALGWMYYGSNGYGDRVNSGYSAAAYLSELVASHPDLVLVSPNPPACLQVCFYFAPQGELRPSKDDNSALTFATAREIKKDGFSVDHSSGTHGHFFRAVAHPGVSKGILEKMIQSVVQRGNQILVESI